MDRVGTRHECLCRGASRIHACAAKFIAFDNGDGFAGIRKPRCQGRTRLARPDNDCIEVLDVRGSVVQCSWFLRSPIVD